MTMACFGGSRKRIEGREEFKSNPQINKKKNKQTKKYMGISAAVAVGIRSTVKDLEGYCGFSDTANTQNTWGVAATQ